jgi:hypothetical protein
MASALTRLVAAFGFVQNDCETPAAEAESLRDRPANPDFGAVAGYAVSLAVNPDLPRSVLNLIDPGAESSHRIAYSSRDGNFPAGVTTRVANDLPDTGAGRTSCQKQGPHQEQQGKREPAKKSVHETSANFKLHHCNLECREIPASVTAQFNRHRQGQSRDSQL